MNFRDLTYLVNLADLKHFGKAAKASFVSQPTLSMQLKKLENELDVQLIERRNKQVLVTPAGERIVAQARIILREVQQLKDLAKSAQDPLCGDMRIGIIPTLAPYLLPKILGALNKNLPKVQFYFHEDKTDRILEQLKQGALDAIILALPVNSDKCLTYPLFDEPFFVALPAKHTLNKKTQINLSDLNNETTFLLEDGHCFRDQALDICHRAGAKEPGNFRATSLETLRYMVATGAGITLLPALSIKQNPQQNKLISIKPFAKPVPTRSIALLVREQSSCIECAEKIAETISQEIKKGL